MIIHFTSPSEKDVTYSIRNNKLICPLDTAELMSQELKFDNYYYINGNKDYVIGTDGFEVQRTL